MEEAGGGDRDRTTEWCFVKEIKCAMCARYKQPFYISSLTKLEYYDVSIIKWPTD